MSSKERPVKYLNNSIALTEGEYIIFRKFEDAATNAANDPYDGANLEAYDFMDKLYHAPTPGMSKDDEGL